MSDTKAEAFALLVASTVKPADWPQDAEWAFTDGESLFFCTDGRFGMPGQSWAAHRNIQPGADELRIFESRQVNRQRVAEVWEALT